MTDDLAKEVAKGALRIEWKDTETAARRVAEYAAARIKELEAKLLARDGELKAKAQIIEELSNCVAVLEAKLVKAVEVAEKSIKWLRLYGADVHREAATLAELKGEDRG